MDNDEVITTRRRTTEEVIDDAVKNIEDGSKEEFVSD